MRLEEMREFVQSNRKLRFEAEGREALYGLVERVLKCKTLNLTSQTAKQVECFGQRKTPFALLYFSILHWPEPVKAGTSAPARP
jgi:hypothetical protein